MPCHASGTSLPHPALETVQIRGVTGQVRYGAASGVKFFVRSVCVSRSEAEIVKTLMWSFRAGARMGSRRCVAVRLRAYAMNKVLPRQRQW